MRKVLAVIAAASSLAGAPVAAAQQAAGCVDRADATALVLAVSPDLLRATGQKCAAALPADAMLRRPDSALIAKYQRASDVSWAGAARALRTIVGPQMSGMLNAELARSMTAPMVVPMLTRNISADDCGKIDRIVTLLAPLPAQNAGALLTTIYEITQEARIAESVTGRQPVFKICTDKRS